MQVMFRGCRVAKPTVATIRQQGWQVYLAASSGVFVFSANACTPVFNSWSSMLYTILCRCTKRLPEKASETT